MNLREELAGISSVGITSHEKPDGDAVGASLALAMYLDALFAEEKRDVRVDVYLDDYPDNLKKHIPGTRFLRDKKNAGKTSYDVFIILDASIVRTGEIEEVAKQAGKRINIDHHITNEGGADVCEIDGKASSTCEVLYRLMEKPLIDKEIAQALYVGLITDTGCFKYSNTSPATLRMGADLITFGFDFPSIVQETFFERTYLQQKILGKVLTESSLLLDGRLIIGMLSHAEMQEFGARKEDIDGVSSDLKLTAGTNCSVFLYENEADSWRISLRSDEKVNVAAVAEQFAGGGHARAAGCRAKGKTQDFLPELIRLVEAELEKTNG